MLNSVTSVRNVFYCFAFLLQSFVVLGQQEPRENFFYEDGKVFWQQVFVKENSSADSLKAAFKDLILPRWQHSLLATTDEGFTFHVTDGVIDFKKYGGSNLSIGLFAKQGHAFDVLAQFRDGRYRIRIFNIENIEMRMESVNQPIEESLIKRGETFYDSKMVNKGMRVINAYFTEQFTLPERAKKSKKKNDW